MTEIDVSVRETHEAGAGEVDRISQHPLSFPPHNFDKSATRGIRIGNSPLSETKMSHVMNKMAISREQSLR